MHGRILHEVSFNSQTKINRMLTHTALECPNDIVIDPQAGPLTKHVM